ncbi:hypothetical protein AVEN_253486-1 [Araneus ventricosus]|uniref:Uncharacterized protein n=1 Tax=Araneus ventricosus TaxID=182803 RepID=A0A4Y2BU83_ARAVE|nr:hypothetical protein AVEN_253486-1 [Araneus ventricosus]
MANSPLTSRVVGCKKLHHSSGSLEHAVFWQLPLRARIMDSVPVMVAVVLVFVFMLLVGFICFSYFNKVSFCQDGLYYLRDYYTRSRRKSGRFKEPA